MYANPIPTSSFRIPLSLYTKSPLSKTSISLLTPFKFKLISFQKLPSTPSATSSSTTPTSFQPIHFFENLSSGESVEDEAPLASFGVDVGLGGRGKRIKEKIEKELDPVELEIEDVFYQHAGHAGVRGSGDGETHFNLKVVSEKFEGKSLVKRHRLIYNLLQEELQSGLHALSIVAKTPSEVSQG